MAEHSYPTTRWTIVRMALDANDPERARQAMHDLCVHYYDAIVGYLRLKLGAQGEAEDAAHAFMERWLKRGSLAGIYRPGETQFRRFLAVCLKRFYLDWLRKQDPPPPEPPDPEPLMIAGETDGNVSDDAANRLDCDIAHICARTAVERLREAWKAKPGPRCDAYGAIARQVFLGDPRPQQEIAEEFGVPLSTVKGWVLTLRQDYLEHFAAEVARLADPLDQPELLRHLVTLAPFQRDGTSFFPTCEELFR